MNEINKKIEVWLNKFYEIIKTNHKLGKSLSVKKVDP